MIRNEGTAVMITRHPHSVHALLLTAKDYRRQEGFLLQRSEGVDLRPSAIPSRGVAVGLHRARLRVGHGEGVLQVRQRAVIDVDPIALVDDLGYQLRAV